MKKILSTRVLVKICVLTTILLVLIIYTIWGNSALMVSMVNISSDRIPETNCQGLFNQIHKKATKKCQKQILAPDTFADGLFAPA